MNDAILQAEGGVKLTLTFGSEKKDVVLRYDFGSQCILSEVMKETITDINCRIRAAYDPIAMRAAIWAGMLWKEPELKLQDLNSIVISEEERYEIMIKLAKAITNSSITEEEVEELAKGLALVDKAPDPKRLARVIRVAMETEIVQEALKTGDSASGLLALTLESNPQISGDSPSGNSSISSSDTKEEKKKTVDEQP